MSFCANCISERGPFVRRDGFTFCISCAGGSVVVQDYVTPTWRRQRSQSRREQLRAANRCINGPLEDRPGKKYGVVHGPVVQGGKCQHCINTHAKTSARRAA